MSVEPATLDRLFVQLVDQGVQNNYLPGILKTLDGQSLLTVDHVHTFIKTWMHNHGRATALEIARELNVEQSSILDAWSVLAPQENWTMADDVLLSRAFIDAIPDQLKSQIDQAGGYLSIVTLTQHLRLPYNFLSKLLDPIIADRYVKLAQAPDLIMTPSYLARAKSSILEPLEQATEPLSLFKLQRNGMLESQETLFYVLLDSLVRDNQLEGTFRGRREKSVYVPHSYRDSQITLITSLLEASGYIEYATVEQHYDYINARDLLLRHDGNIQLFDTCAVTPALLEKLQSTVENVANGWVDMAQHVPFVFTAGDTASLLDVVIARIPKKQRPAVLGSRFVTTTDYLKSLVTAAQPYLDRRALHEIQQEKKLHSGKGKKKLNDEKSAGKLTDDEIYDYLVEEQNLNADFAECAVPVIKKSMLEAFAKALQTVYIAPSLLSNSLSGPAQREKDTLRELRRKIYYTRQSVLLFEDDSARKSLEKYVVRQLGLQFIFHLTLLSCIENGENPTDLVNATQEDVMKEKVSTFCKEQSNDHYGVAGLAPAVLNAKKADDLIRYLSETPPDFVAGDSLDESTQRESCQSVKEALVDQLKSTSPSLVTAPSILHLTSVLCFQSLYHLPLYVSGKYVPHIIKQIAPKMEPRDGQTLSEAHDMIMKSRKDAALFDPDVLQNVHELGLKIK
ncbi:hypothetical protein BJV82DRAFT_600831 [Fennellomyces sp. T-0311]|nr:hypothetical protein BJV82DRAFT_600831 [Fennellomyces sp. T-0311]